MPGGVGRRGLAAPSYPIKEIWLVDKAPVVIEKLGSAVAELSKFMESQGLESKPEEVPNLKGDAAKAKFVNLFKEVQRLKTQLDQYTDLTDEHKAQIEKVIPKEALQAFKGVYIDTAQHLRTQQDTGSDCVASEVQQLDFEFVLFASTVIDYDYIMALIAKYSSQTAGKVKMSPEQLIGLIASDAKFMDEREDIEAYIYSLEKGKVLSEEQVREGYLRFKSEKIAQALSDIAAKHGISAASLKEFVDGVLRRMIFDGEQLSELLAPLDLGWKARTQKELDIVGDIAPLLHRLSAGRDISGLSAYER